MQSSSFTSSLSPDNQINVQKDQSIFFIYSHTGMDENDLDMNANNLQTIFSSPCISPLWPQWHYWDDRVRQGRQNAE